MNIHCDITSNCNLRCPFCVNNWSENTKHDYMLPATFAKVLDLAQSPMVGDDGLFMSCAFEPIIHPQFADLLRMIPPEIKQKVFVTTNLTLPLSDDLLDAMCCANLHHINVSCESLIPEIYESMRRGAKYDMFISNLERLAAGLRCTPDAPELHMITMLFRQNRDGIESFVEICRNRFGITKHEIRLPFELSLGYMDVDWIAASVLPATDADSVQMVDDGVTVRLDNTGDTGGTLRIMADGMARLL